MTVDCADAPAQASAARGVEFGTRLPLQHRARARKLARLNGAQSLRETSARNGDKTLTAHIVCPECLERGSADCLPKLELAELRVDGSPRRRGIVHGVSALFRQLVGQKLAGGGARIQPRSVRDDSRWVVTSRLPQADGQICVDDSCGRSSTYPAGGGRCEPKKFNSHRCLTLKTNQL
jgi:hypothetical protein